MVRGRQLGALLFDADNLLDVAYQKKIAEGASEKGACEVERGDAKYAIMILGEFEVREFACLLVCSLKCFDHFSRQTYFVYGLHRNRAFWH